MATGRMVGQCLWQRRANFILPLVSCLLTGMACATDVGLAGVTSSRAMLVIDGSEPQSLGVGQAVDRVKLISLQGDQALVEVDGKRRSLRVGQHAVGAARAEGEGQVVLTADSQGHFLTSGTVNGTSVKFLVDTGASLVSLGAADARRIGLDGNQGQRDLTQTAGGVVVVSRVRLDTVRIGDITLHNVDALIHPNDLPVALLGMSFLNRMEMQRDGSSMKLKKRF